MHLQPPLSIPVCVCVWVCVCVSCHIFQVSNEQIAYHVPVSIPKVYLHVLVGVLKIAEIPTESSCCCCQFALAGKNPQGICGNCRHDLKFLNITAGVRARARVRANLLLLLVTARLPQINHN